MASNFMWGSGFGDGAATAAATLPSNPSPPPPTDLAQLLLAALQYSTDADLTQAIITDYQSPSAETLTASDGGGATTISAPYTYDEGTHSAWGYAHYV